MLRAVGNAPLYVLWAYCAELQVVGVDALQSPCRSLTVSPPPTASG